MTPLRSASRFMLVAGLCALPGLLAGATDPAKPASTTFTSPAVLPGQSATHLADGTWLILGGFGSGGKVTGQAVLLDSTLQQRQVLAQTLNVPRAGQSATVLPDGTVLVAGGVGPLGQPVAELERYRPDTQLFENLGDVGLPARSGQTATLLTDGTLLIVGGTDGSTLVHADAEVFDPATLQLISENASLIQPRTGQEARLLPTGNVLVWGGSTQHAETASSAEIYNPATGQFQQLDAASAASLIMEDYPTVAPTVVATTPEAGSKNVSVDARLTLRFSKPLRPETVTGLTVTLLGPNGTVDASVVAAEGGRLAFVTPKEPLLPASSYTLFVKGAQDSSLRQVQFTTIPFRTAALPARPPQMSISTVAPSSEPTKDAGPSDFDRELWLPARNNLNGVWRSGQGRHAPTPKDLPKAPPGVTAVSGVVLRLRGEPLSNVTLSIGKQKVVTNAKGEFLLAGVPSGAQTLVIDGATANTREWQYGRYEYLAKIEAEKTNALPFVIWMTRLDTRNAHAIPSPTTAETIVRNPRIPGLELHIPAGTVIRDSQGKNVTEITITPIPVDQPPFPLPNHWVPVFFTIQPGGAHLQGLNVQAASGAKLIYPNFGNSPSGSRIDFWNYDPVVKGWYIYGQGTVSPNRKQIVPDPGVVVYEFTGAMVAQPSTAPTVAPVACSGGGGAGSPNAPAKAGDPVDCFTGLYVQTRTDLYVRDVWPLVIQRTYRPLDSISRAFGVGANLSYDLFLTGDVFPYTYQNLILADGSRIYYPRISPGTGYTDAIYQTETPGPYFGSTIRWNNANGWTLTFPNGTTYSFPDSYQLSSARCAAAVGMQDRYGNSLTFARDSYCNLTSVTSPNGHRLSFAYDSSNRITQASDDSGRTVTYSYDAGGRLVTATNPAGNGETYTYDSSSNLLTVTDKRGNVTVTNAYDANGRVIQQTYADGTTSSFNYVTDSNGVTTQMTYTDERGGVKQVQFNPAGYPVSITRALGAPEQQTVTFARDANTNLAQSVTDALGRTTALQYDANGDITQITLLSGTGNATTWTYSYSGPFGQLTSITDPAGHTTSYSYDNAGNLVTATDALGEAVNVAHNASGQVTSVTLNPGGGTPLTTSFGYNNGILSSVTDPLKRTTYYFNDGLGRPRIVQDALGSQTQLSYNVLDYVTKTTDPLGNSAQLSYDANGNLISVQDPRGNVTSYAYDARNRVASMTDGLGQNEVYGYDAIGNLVQSTDRNGQVMGYTYDFLNRLTTAGFGASVPSPTAFTSTIGYTWDAGNRLTQAVDSLSGAITRTYDGLDELLQEQSPQGLIAYSYGSNGLRQSMRAQGQVSVTYTYDNANRLTQVAQGAATVTLGYDNANRRTSLTLPNGVQVSYAYDDASELTSITYQSSTTLLGNLIYGYDADGRRTSMGGSLAQVSLPAPVATASYDAGNRLIDWGGVPLTYDPNGQVTAVGSSTYSWDARHRLTATSDGAGGFSYDALGRRISRTVSGATASYLYDGLNAVTINGDFMLTGLGVDEVYARINTAGVASYLTDGLGSTLALTDGSAHTLASYIYEPYGRSTKTGSDDTAIQFTGRENDGASNLYYYRARYYSPQLGRFISEDPLGLGGGTNFYAYASGNPISRRDPLGLWDWPSLPQGVANASAGIGDALLLDQGARLRRLLNIDGGVDTCSASYKGGQVAGIIGSFADGEGEVQLSERVLARMLEEPGAYHNFPFSIALEALQGEGKVISSNYTLYSLEGAINGVNGAYEVGVNAANQITHYFFRPF